MKRYLFPVIALLVLIAGTVFLVLRKTVPIPDRSDLSTNHFAAVGLSQFQTEETVQEFLDNALPHGSDETIPDPPGGQYVQLIMDEGVEFWVTLDSTGSLMNVLPYFQAKNRNMVGIIKRNDPPEVYDTGGFLAFAEDPLRPAESFRFTFDCPDYRMFHTPPDMEPVKISLSLFAHRTEVYPDEAELNRTTEGTLAYPEFLSADPSSNTSFQSEVLVTGLVQDIRKINNMITGEKYIWVSLGTKILTIDIVGEPKIFKTLPKKGQILEASGWLVGRILG